MFFAKLLKMKDVKLYRRHKIKIRISEKKTLNLIQDKKYLLEKRHLMCLCIDERMRERKKW